MLPRNSSYSKLPLPVTLESSSIGRMELPPLFLLGDSSIHRLPKKYCVVPENRFVFNNSSLFPILMVSYRYIVGQKRKVIKRISKESIRTILVCICTPQSCAPACGITDRG